MRRAWLAIASVLALAGGSCNGNETGPVVGDLIVRLSTPNSDDCAVLLQLVGTQTAVRSAPGHLYGVYTSSATGDTLVVAVVAPAGRALAAGELLRLSVPDTRMVRSYAATLTQVAGADYQLRDVGPYRLMVAKP